MYVSTKNCPQKQVLELLKIILFINFKIQIQILWMEHTGENLQIKNGIHLYPVLSRMGTIIKYTAAYTLQQNGKVGHAFPTLFWQQNLWLVMVLKCRLNLSKNIQQSIQRHSIINSILHTKGNEIGPTYLPFFAKECSLHK